jgi:hypothetical protein
MTIMGIHESRTSVSELDGLAVSVAIFGTSAREMSDYGPLTNACPWI